MSTNRFPGYLTLVRPLNGHPRQAATPTHIARHKRYDRPVGERDEFGVASRHALLLQLDTIGELAPTAPLSFLVISVSGLSALEYELGERACTEALKTTAETIAIVTRATDMVGWMSESGFGVVLQGTGSIGATAVGARLAHHLDRALTAYPHVRAEVGTATGSGVNAEMLPVAAMDRFLEL